ncbi:MAG TPA: hypothetical protein VKB86_22475 [Pyrinomonadaceae bacterium]|nr:hypothetical protein [Pyrinomonadaceae bacterium]
MFLSGQGEPLVPFPSLSGTTTSEYAPVGLMLRPFGLYESDLNVNFNRAARPLLVTEILQCCTRDARGRAVDQGFFWEMTIGKRIECLLKIISSTDAREINVTFHCANEACGQELETEMAVSEICALQDEAYMTEHVPIRVEDASLSLRRPKARDQMAWLKSSFRDEEAAMKAMLLTLLPTETDEQRALIEVKAHYDEWIQSIDRAMEEHDPLVNFTLLSQCPYCEEENLCEIDLEELALGRLRLAQLRLLESVHRLATHYHWSEQQVFSVPYWRRAYYLGLIEKGKNL